MSNKAPDKSGYYWVRCVMDNFYGEWQIIFYDGAEIETCGFKRKLQLKDIGEWGEEVTHQSLSVETPEELKEEISEIIFKNKWFFSNNKEHADMLVEKLSPSITRYASAIKEKAVKETAREIFDELDKITYEYKGGTGLLKAQGGELMLAEIKRLIKSKFLPEAKEK